MRTNELYIPAPTRKAAALTVQTPRIAHHLHVDQRLGGALLVGHPQRRGGRRPPRAGRRCGGRPSPTSEPSLMPTSRQTSQPESRNAPSQLTRPGTLIGDSGTKNTVATVATTTRTSGNPEQPVVVERVDDRAGQDDAQPAADAEDRRDQRDAVRDALARELVADDPERQREDRAAAALDHAGRRSAPRCWSPARRAGCRRRARASENDERALLAEHVAQAPDDRREDRRAQQVGGQDPGRPRSPRHGARAGSRAARARRATAGWRTSPAASARTANVRP